MKPANFFEWLIEGLGEVGSDDIAIAEPDQEMDYENEVQIGMVSDTAKLILAFYQKACVSFCWDLMLGKRHFAVEPRFISLLDALLWFEIGLCCDIPYGPLTRIGIRKKWVIVSPRNATSRVVH